VKPFQLPMTSDGHVEHTAWPGGYPLFYLMGDGETMCPTCVESNLEQIGRAEEFSDGSWSAMAVDVNWEDPAMFCCHCDERIPSAYAEDEVVL
jgi:hypothetical protein